MKKRTKKPAKTSFQKQFSQNADWPDIVYGINPITEAILSKRRKVYEVLIHSVRKDDPIFDKDPLVQLLRKHDVPYSFCDKQRLNELSRFGVHQGFVARVSRFEYKNITTLFDSKEKKQFFVILDCINDPQNYGAICRSAYAFGVDAIIVPKNNMAPINEVVCKASSGAIEHLSVVQVTNVTDTIKKLKKLGFWIYGMSLNKNSVDIKQFQPSEKTVIVLGSEGKGIRRLVQENCDQLIKISLNQGFDSINVAQAASIIFYETYYAMS